MDESRRRASRQVCRVLGAPQGSSLSRDVLQSPAREGELGRHPLRPERIEPIKDVRRAIDALPEPDRDWVLLWVCDQFWSNGPDDEAKHLASNADLVAAGKRLGPAKLMEALTGKVPFDDPDIAGRPGRPPLSKVVLANAAELLRTGDADLLLATAARDETKSPRWIIAAAAVSPDRAEGLLEDALKTFKGYNPGTAAKSPSGFGRSSARRKPTSWSTGSIPRRRRRRNRAERTTRRSS